MSTASCDVCGAALVRSERRRLVWDPGRHGELVLADVCSGCAIEVDPLLERHGGHGRDAIRLKQPDAVSRKGPVRKLGAVAVRSTIYLSIALASFLLITWLTSRA